MQISLKLHLAKYACRYRLTKLVNLVSSCHHNSIVLTQYSFGCNSPLQDPLTKSEGCQGRESPTNMPCLWHMMKMELTYPLAFRCVFTLIRASHGLCTLYRILLFLDHRVMNIDAMLWYFILNCVCQQVDPGTSTIYRRSLPYNKRGAFTDGIRALCCLLGNNIKLYSGTAPL